MKFNVFLIILTITLIFFSCDKVTERYVRSYVTSYGSCHDIELEDKSNHPEYVIRVTFPFEQKICSIFSKGDKETLFNQLGDKHGDNYYNRKIRFIGSPVNDYLITDPVSITVQSNKNYDNLHPAGSNLSDIVKLISVSPLRYIHSGYKDLFNWSGCQTLTNYEKTLYNMVNGSNEFHLTQKTLSDVEVSDLELIGTGLYAPYLFLKFLKLPDVSGEHIFTVEVKMEDGKILTNTIPISFISGSNN